jgi:hypothetical protein
MTSLRFVLRANAAVCLLFGGLFVVSPAMIGGFLGQPPRGLIGIIGIGLIAQGAHLLIASRRTVLWPAEVLWFAGGDLLWWFATLVLLAMQIWITTRGGIAAATIVAVVVAGFGLAQIWRLGTAAKGDVPDMRQIGQSWVAMPGWVKVWLFALNAVFLAAFAFVPSDMSRIALIAYAATGPLLLAFVFRDGGLTRRAGIGHLIPWVPLLVWLVVRLMQGGLSPAETAYGILLAVMVAICLGFDLYDLARWQRGARDTLGQSEGARADHIAPRAVDQLPR